MPEYYVVTQSKAAPFFSDSGYQFVEAETPQAALEKARAEYNHPAGLFAAAVYTDANAERKGEKALDRWLCPRADRRTNGLRCKCGKMAPLVVGNTGPRGVTDAHRCECGREIRFDTSLE